MDATPESASSSAWSAGRSGGPESGCLRPSMRALASQTPGSSWGRARLTSKRRRPSPSSLRGPSTRPCGAWRWLAGGGSVANASGPRASSVLALLPAGASPANRADPPSLVCEPSVCRTWPCRSRGSRRSTPRPARPRPPRGEPRAVQPSASAAAQTPGSRPRALRPAWRSPWGAPSTSRACPF